MKISLVTAVLTVTHLALGFGPSIVKGVHIPEARPVDTFELLEDDDDTKGASNVGKRAQAKELCPSVEGTCGGKFEGSSGCVASPNYGKGDYGNELKCNYEITVPAGQRVELMIQDMDIEKQKTCQWDKLEVVPGEGIFGTERICGNKPPAGTFVSVSNKMFLHFISDEDEGRKGFAAKFRAISLD